MNPHPPKPQLAPVAALLADFSEAACQQAFRVERFGQTGEFPLIALTKRTPGPRPRIYLSAGIHGDEPAPPQTLLALLQSGFFADRAHWFICPVLNPNGLQRSTREDVYQRDLNRDYQHRQSLEVRAHTDWLQRQPPFDLALCLHEDWEAQGFYLYELNRQNRPSVASAITRAVSAILPIEPAALIDGREIDEPGIIRPISDPLLRTDWPEAIYLAAEFAPLCYTLETPSSFPLDQRIAALRVAIDTCITTATRV